MDSKNLLKGTMVYLLANFITKMGSLIFLPIMTRLLTQEEFGIIGTLAPVTSLFTIILGLGLYNAQIKKYVSLQDNEEEFGSYMFSTMAIISVLNIVIFAFLFTPASRYLFSLVLNLDKVDYNSLVIISMVIAAVNAVNNLAITMFRMKKLYTKAATASLLSFFTNYILAIYFIKYLKMGVFGNQLANLIAVLLITLYSFRDYFGKFRFKIKREYVNYALINGVPLIFIELTDQIVNVSDRWVLAKVVSLSVVGYYTLAYTGGRVLSVVTASFISSWIPELYEAMEKDPKNPRITASVENFLGLTTFICISGQLFAPEIIKLIFPANYHTSINYVGIILASVVIQSLYCLDYFFHYHEKSIVIFYFSLFAMVFNLTGNLIFIPKYPEYGGMIAAWTTLTAFLFKVIIELFIIKKWYNIKFNYKKLLLYFILIVNPLVFYLGNENISVIKFIVKLLYFAVSMKLLINKENFMKIKGMALKIKNKIIRG